MTEIPDEIEERLDAPQSMHLATCVDDHPHVAPVWFNYRDGIVETLTKGRKVENVRVNPRVALSIDRMTDGHAEWMVGMQGTATVIDDPGKIRAAMVRVFTRYLGPKSAWPEEFQTQYDEANRTLLEISIGTVSGFP